MLPFNENSPEFKTECAWFQVRFVGFQQFREGISFPLFRDLITGTTLCVKAEESLAEAVARSRKKFEEGKKLDG